MSEASTRHEGGDVAAASSPPSAGAHGEPDPADDLGDPSPVDVAPESPGEKWSDLRHKPVLQWTKDDWALWAGGPQKDPEDSSVVGGDVTEPESTLHAVAQPAAEEAQDRHQEPLPEATAEVAPSREAPPRLRLEHGAAPELGEHPPEEAKALGVQLPASPPAPSEQPLPQPRDEPRSPAPSGPTRAESKPGAARGTDRRSHTASPPTRVRARIPSAMPATPLGSTIRLAALSIMVGVVLAGVITAALVVTAIALSQALG